MAINEQCYEYDECNDYVTYFINKGKPVFNCEYKGGCSKATISTIDTIIKNLVRSAFIFVIEMHVGLTSIFSCF
jgi:hypothetical protein